MDMTFSSAVALFGAMFFLALVPGPSVVAVVARAISSGFVHGLVTTLGIVVGDILFIVLAIFGLSAIPEALDSLFVLVKYLGSAYLVWLGIALWRSHPQSIEVQGTQEISWQSNFLCGLLMTLGDPKAILFYVSFLPAFLTLSEVSILDVGLLIAIATVAVGSPKLGYAFVADKSRFLLRSTRARRTINISAGSVMCVTGLFLAIKP